MATAAAGGRRRRVLFFPLPYQGHINPMFQLAGLLHARGFAVTIFHTHFNAPDASAHRDYDFVPVPDGMPEGGHPLQDIAKRILDMNRACEAPFRERLAALLERREGDDVACLVADAHLLAMVDVARGLGVPTLVLRTASAACFRCFLAYPMLHEKGYLPPQESDLDMPVKELPPLRVKDLYYSRRVDNELVTKLLTRATQAVKNSSGLVINTSDALEKTELERIRDELNIPMVLPVGPLHKLSSKSVGSSLLNQDYGCIEWLETRPSKSVLYVSFGSLASVGSKEFLEVAWGLANSGVPFLWVVRPDILQDLDDPNFPNGFEAAVQDRGKLIQWAPQEEVLAHRAVGGFWTHNGWNSTLESICEGVPMMCRPQFADQPMNTRYVEQTWGVGFELEGVLERGKIEKAVRKLMKDREGDEMRERAKELKNKVEDCLKIGGSSQIAIDKLVNYLLAT
ncbi:UDP-glycosyltransferase 76B1 isoform X1 [Setaria italica]|nr:UDP-glycosyltransferase 76B1 isoform X1 [Setaria italica]